MADERGAIYQFFGAKKQKFLRSSDHVFGVAIASVRLGNAGRAPMLSGCGSRPANAQPENL
jgi:hypothetical protein